jgi:prolyl 4-hydroxylase
LLDAPAPIWADEPVCDGPRIAWRRGLFSVAECRYLMDRAEPLLRPSFVVDPKSGARIPHPVRTSAGMNFGPTHEDLVVAALNRRIAAATDTEAGWGEPLHILRYAPGQEYRPHLDALTGTTNQRRWTMLVYLNDDFEGGETAFPELGIVARGAVGDALLFENTDTKDRPDPRTVHAGRPVTSGVKWLATRWIRERRHLPWDA